jgi:hypothetical protein
MAPGNAPNRARQGPFIYNYRREHRQAAGAGGKGALTYEKRKRPYFRNHAGLAHGGAR